jgi:hypothetical protein
MLFLDDISELYQDQIKKENKSILKYSRVPVAVWFTGSLLIIFGIFIMFYVGLAKTERLFDGVRRGFKFSFV